MRIAAGTPLVPNEILSPVGAAGIETGGRTVALARRAQEVHLHLQSLKTLPPGEPWRENRPFHHLDLDLGGRTGLAGNLPG